MTYYTPDSRKFTPTERSGDAYRIWGIFYNGLAWLYSGGAIGRSKRQQLAYLGGQSVCYVGVGSGEDAADAVRDGASVTVVDRSAAMLGRLRLGFQRQGLSQPQVVQGDVFRWLPSEPFDVLVTNFFLNQFSRRDLIGHLKYLRQFLRSGGLWMVADFHLAGRNPLKHLYWMCPLIPAHFATGEALHRFYDYVPLFREMGFEVVAEQGERVASVGPQWYRNLVFQAP